MTVLGIETATAVCGAAVVRDGAVVALCEREEPRIHAEQLPGFIDTVLREAGIAPTDVDGVAVSAGPGSFTGLRIGLSTAKGLVYATGAALVGVPTMEVLALRCVRAGGVHDRLIMTVIGARQGEAYAQLFDATAFGVVARGDVQDVKVGDLPTLLSGRNAVITGDGMTAALEVLEQAGVPCTPAGREVRSCSAADVALVGERMLARGHRDDPVTLEPRYIKEFFLRER